MEKTYIWNTNIFLPYGRMTSLMLKQNMALKNNYEITYIAKFCNNYM